MKKVNHNFIPAMTLVLALGALSVGWPYLTRSFSGGSPSTVIENAEVVNVSNPETVTPSEEELGGIIEQGPRFFQGTLEVKGIFTRQEQKLGTKFSKALDLSSGNTTTPGLVLSLQNTGNTQICYGPPIIELTRQIEGSMNFAAGTSSLPTTWSGAGTTASGGSLLATSTVATGTVGFIQSRLGTAFLPNGGQSATPSSTNAWLWSEDVYILVALDKGGTDAGAGTRNNATTTDYNTAAGKLYVPNCIER